MVLRNPADVTIDETTWDLLAWQDFLSELQSKLELELPGLWVYWLIAMVLTNSQEMEKLQGPWPPSHLLTDPMLIMLFSGGPRFWDISFYSQSYHAIYN